MLEGHRQKEEAVWRRWEPNSNRQTATRRKLNDVELRKEGANLKWTARAMAYLK